MTTYLEVLGAIGATVGLLSASIGGLWAYTKFAIERGSFPPSQMNLELTCVGEQGGEQVLEILIRIKNLGATVLVVRSLWIDVHCLHEGDDCANSTDKWTRLGRLDFGESVLPRLSEEQTESAQKADVLLRSARKGKRTPSGVPVVPYRTFVQAGVDQVYTYVTCVPATARIVRVRSQFEPDLRMSEHQKLTLDLAKQLGLTQFTLSQVTEPHTCERVFCVAQARVTGKP